MMPLPAFFDGVVKPLHLLRWWKIAIPITEIISYIGGTIANNLLLYNLLLYK